jgi:hypothetical protein
MFPFQEEGLSRSSERDRSWMYLNGQVISLDANIGHFFYARIFDRADIVAS